MSFKTALFSFLLSICTVTATFAQEQPVPAPTPQDPQLRFSYLTPNLFMASAALATTVNDLSLKSTIDNPSASATEICLLLGRLQQEANIGFLRQIHDVSSLSDDQRAQRERDGFRPFPLSPPQGTVAEFVRNQVFDVIGAINVMTGFCGVRVDSGTYPPAFAATHPPVEINDRTSLREALKEIGAQLFILSWIACPDETSLAGMIIRSNFGIRGRLVRIRAETVRAEALRVAAGTGHSEQH